MLLPLIGELNRRVSGYGIEHSGGAVSASLTKKGEKLFELWGKIEPVGGVAYYESVNLEQTVTHRVWLRFVPGQSDPVSLAHLTEVEAEGVWYRVKRVTDVNGAHRFMCCECELLGAKRG